MNTVFHLLACTLSAILCLGLPAAAQPQDEAAPQLTIIPDAFQQPGIVRYDWLAPNAGVPADSGEALRQIPGVSGVRMGGHGIDPVIRGQGQSRLNVILDGAYVQGGCPNRMDPPTAYAPISSYEDIEIVKGGHSVRYGEGGSGGIVLFRRENEPLVPGKHVKARIENGFVSNSDQQSYDLDITAGSTRFYTRAAASHERANSYKDGSGDSVRSAFETSAVSVSTGTALTQEIKLDLGWEHNEADDVEFAGAGMDSPSTENRMYRAGFNWNPRNSPLASLRVRGFRSKVDHLMDNFSLRPVPEGGTFLSADSDSKTVGGSVEAALARSTWEAIFGIDARSIEQSASRLAGPSAERVASLQSVLWPDAATDRWGLFSEMEVEMDSTLTLKSGLRLDSVYAAARGADRKPAGTLPTPNQLYQRYYGAEAAAANEVNLSAFSKAERQLYKGRRMNWNAYLLGSRSVRTADATERFIAAMSPKAPKRWIGNPFLDPEKHHQLEVGILGKSKHRKLTFSLFHDWVDDYIIRDRARGQAGIRQDDLASVYRNVRARLLGGELDAAALMADALQARVALSYVWANNESDDRPIAQIPPLQGLFSLEYLETNWRVGSQLRFAATQTRVEDNLNTGSGLDAGETSGYAAVDIFGELSLTDSIQLQAGVRNVLDKTYAEHLNKPNAFDPETLQINEPGVSCWLKLAARI